MEEQTRESIQPGRKAEWYADKLKNFVSAIYKRGDFTQRELAEMGGVSRETISEWKNMDKDNVNMVSLNSNKKDTKEELKK
ncbi:MAG: helix-turn-helix domain-containing protein, partial [Promethearchaeota archaeon]